MRLIIGNGAIVATCEHATAPGADAVVEVRVANEALRARVSDPVQVDSFAARPASRGSGTDGSTPLGSRGGRPRAPTGPKRVEER